MDSQEKTKNEIKKDIRLFFCGDVMTGRGIDQILPHPSKPEIYESFVTDARDYVYLAEAVNGKIYYPVTMDYIWGDALSIWQQQKPDVKIVNLETAITQSDTYLRGKGINYRMNPLNVDVLTTAQLDICTLANNHILDWDEEGLRETLKTLDRAGIQFSGAGETIHNARQPAIFNLENNKRVLVFSLGTPSSGVSSAWEATSSQPGLYFLPDISKAFLSSIIENIKKYQKSGDLIVFSIHWGSNWGYTIPEYFRSFAHRLIDEGNVNIIFGHSSHHPRSIEIYHDKPILYGCGDFINDYEGISGYEAYRGDLTFMYFLDFDRLSLEFEKITLVPLQIKKFRLQLANKNDTEWMLHTLNNSSSFCAQFKLTSVLDHQQLIHKKNL